MGIERKENSVGYLKSLEVDEAMDDVREDIAKGGSGSDSLDLIDPKGKIGHLKTGHVKENNRS